MCFAAHPPVWLAGSPQEHGVNRFDCFQFAQMPGCSVQPEGFGQENIDVREELAIVQCVSDCFCLVEAERAAICARDRKNPTLDFKF